MSLEFSKKKVGDDKVPDLKEFHCLGDVFVSLENKILEYGQINKQRAMLLRKFKYLTIIALKKIKI